MKMSKKALGVAALGVLAAGAVTASAIVVNDFGIQRDSELASEADDLFGVAKPLAASSTLSITKDAAIADPASLATVAKGLKVSVVSAGKAAPVIDQFALWPNAAKPKWIIACNEQGPTAPGLQRISLATGDAETILTGTNACDGVRLTAWGTILFSEESGPSGATFELIDPLGTTGVTLDRATGVFSGGTGAANFARRDAVGRLSFEGHGLLPNGVMYYGDEKRPGGSTSVGGSYFKFVPTTPFVPGSPAVTSLAQSPLAAGQVFGLKVGNRNDNGFGTSTGLGSWVPVPAASVADLGKFAVDNKLTAYYRPEDLEVSPTDLAKGDVKVCGNNTGNEASSSAGRPQGGRTWGETVCITDGTVAQSLAGTAIPEAQYFVVGSSDMAMTDNIAPQPGPEGRWLIAEDGDSEATLKNNDLFLCLKDGADVDDQSDGCVKVATLNDLTAEWTGPIFSADGEDLYVSVQHNISGAGTILKISGFGDE